MRLLITGGSGMIARYAAEAAVARGHRVWLADQAWRDNLAAEGRADRLTFDIRDRDACRAAVDRAGAEAIIHCAAVVGPKRSIADPDLTLAVNVVGTANLLHVAHDHGASLISLSTATLYGNRPDLAPLAETDPASPLTIYDGSKLMAEVYCSTHKRTYGSKVASFRTGFVYGYGSQIGEYFLPRVVAGEAVEDVGGGHPCDFTYAGDLAEALVQAAEAPSLANDVYNVTSGVLRRRSELADAVRSLVPGARISQAPGIDPARHLRGACLLWRAAADFGWMPRFTLEDGLADWLRRLPTASA